MFKLITRDTADKKTKGVLLNLSCNVEGLVEHIRQKVAWERSREFWLERHMKLLLSISNEKWREPARRFEIITGNLREWIDVGI